MQSRYSVYQLLETLNICERMLPESYFGQHGARIAEIRRFISECGAQASQPESDEYDKATPEVYIKLDSISKDIPLPERRGAFARRFANRMMRVDPARVSALQRSGAWEALLERVQHRAEQIRVREFGRLNGMCSTAGSYRRNQRVFQRAEDIANEWLDKLEFNSIL